MKSMWIAAVSVGAVAAALVVYLKKQNSRRKVEQKEKEHARSNGSIRLSQHAMG